MACFLVPVGEAVVITAVSKVMERKKEKCSNQGVESGGTTVNSFLEKRKWLTNLLWGGSALLAFEHLWHGEILPWFPFLSAAYSSEDMVMMWKEMTSVGVVMALVVTIVWVGMVLVSNALKERAVTPQKN